MATTETDAASCRITGRDEDDDKRSTHHRHGRKSRRTQDTGLARQAGATTGARRDPDGQGRSGSEDKKKAGATSGFSAEQHRQSPRNKVAMTERDNEFL